MRILIVLPFIFLFLLFYSFSSGQNVGVGTTTPLEKLDVQGNIKGDTIKPNALLLTPDAGAGKILTSDNLGNASWQPMMTSPPNIESGNIGYGAWGDCETNANISAHQPVCDTAAATNNYFGGSVSVSGQFAIVGAQQDNEGVPAQGSASIFYHNGSSWVFFQKLTDPQPGADDYFGNSVSISGDYAIVGSYHDDETYQNQGSVCIFHYNGTTWELMEKLYQAAAGTNYNFGWSVSISGEYAVVSSPYENFASGSASTFQLTGSSWTLIEQIVDATGEVGDFFGSSVSISGNRLIIGAYLDDIGSNFDQGSASIYQYNGTNWLLMQKIFTNGASHDLFGCAVAISGNNVLVGAFGDDINYQGQGSAALFSFNGITWNYAEFFQDPSGNIDQYFGSSVYLSGRYAMIGVPRDASPLESIQTGSVYIYQNVGLGWQKFQIVFDPGGLVASFGGSVSFDSQTGHFIVGASQYASNSGKVVFGKIR